MPKLLTERWRSRGLHCCAEILLEVVSIHRRYHFDFRAESHEQRLGDGRKLGAVLHVEKDERDEVARLGIQLADRVSQQLGETAVLDRVVPSVRRTNIFSIMRMATLPLLLPMLFGPSLSKWLSRREGSKRRW